MAGAPGHGREEPATDDLIRILDDDDKELPVGTSDRLPAAAPRGSRSTSTQRPSQDRGLFGGDHFTLGDVGYLDEDG